MNRSFTSKLCKVISPRRSSRERRESHAASQAFKNSIKQALLLLISENELNEINFHLQNAEIVLQSLQFRKRLYGDKLPKYEGWLIYTQYIVKYVSNPSERSSLARKHLELLSRKNPYFRNE